MLTAEELCARDITKRISFRDPESVRVERMILKDDGSVTMFVNAKNGFGGYAGAQKVFCNPNVPEQRADEIIVIPTAD